MKSSPSRTIVLDTSFILSMLRDHREFDTEIHDSVREPLRLTTTDGVIMELQSLARRGDFTRAGLAKTALSVLEKRRILVQETLPSTPNVDIGVLTLALGDRGKIEVATVDLRLRRALFKLGISTIYPRRHTGVVIMPGSRVPLK